MDEGESLETGEGLIGHLPGAARWREQHGRGTASAGIYLAAIGQFSGRTFAGVISQNAVWGQRRHVWQRLDELVVAKATLALLLKMLSNLGIPVTLVAKADEQARRRAREAADFGLLWTQRKAVVKPQGLRLGCTAFLLLRAFGAGRP
jgi:hypothetical protein